MYSWARRHWRVELGYLYSRAADRSAEAELPRKPNTVERADAEPVDVEFIPGEAVADAPWIGVVVIMPALSQTQQRYRPLIPASIIGVERALAEGVTDRIDAPGGVAGKKHAYHPSPE